MLLILTLIGAIILLDKYAVGEFGFSQPLVACSIIGLCFGALEAGLFLGVVLQFIFFSNLPIGRSITPDSQAGSILGISSFILLKNQASIENLLTFSFLVALIGSVIGTYTDILVRRFNNRLYQKFIKDESKYFTFHMLGLLFSFLRGFFFLLIALTIVAILNFLPDYFNINKEQLVYLSVVLGVANGLYLFYKKKYIPFLIIGVFLGCLFQLFVS